MSKIVNVGIVQMTCTSKPKENLDKAIVKIREAASKGAQIICLQELFTSLYFCDVEDYENFKLAEPIPGPSTEVLAREAQRWVLSSLPHYLKKAPRDFIIILPRCWMLMAPIWGNTGRCISRMTRPTMKNSISLPEIWDIKSLTPSLRVLVY